MKTSLKNVLNRRVDPLLFVFICLVSILLGVAATALTDDVSSAYDPTLAWLALPTHIYP
jgi:hypothetical protein